MRSYQFPRNRGRRCRGALLLWLCWCTLACNTDRPPIPLTDDTIRAILANNPYDYYGRHLQPALLQFALAGQTDSLQHLITGNRHYANAICHTFIEKSLFFQFFQQPDSSEIFAIAAVTLAKQLERMYQDDFLYRRVELLLKAIKTHPKKLKRWIEAQAVFIDLVERIMQREETGREVFAEHLRFAAERFEKVGDEKKVVDVMSFQYAREGYLQDNIPKALGILSDVYTRSHRIGYLEGVFYGVAYSAYNYGKVGLYDSSRYFVGRAEAIATSLDNSYMKAVILFLKTNLEIFKGNYSQALDAAFLSLEFCRRIGYRNMLSESLQNLANIYQIAKQFDLALSYLQMAIEIEKELDHSDDLPPLNLRRASIFLDLGNYEKALTFADSALQEYKAINHVSGIATTLGLIGMLHYQQERYDDALKMQREAIAMLKGKNLERAEMEVWINTGEIATKSRDMQLAEQALNKSLRLGQRLQSLAGQGRTLAGLGLMNLAKHKSDEAIANFEQALAVAEMTGDRRTIWHCHYGLAQAREQTSDFAAADQEYAIATNELERIRQTVNQLDFNIRYFSTVQEVFDRAIQFMLAAAKDTSAAFHFMEKARARALFDLLQAQLVSVTVSDSERAGQTKAADLSFMAPTAEVAALQGSLDDSTAVLEYRVSQSASYLAVIDRRSVHVTELPANKAEIEHRVKQFRRLIGVDDVDGFSKRFRRERQQLIEETESAAKELYNLLIAPMERWIAPHQSLYLVPDGALFYLPFAALQQVKTGSLLVERFDLAYAPSFASLAIVLRNSSTFDGTEPSKPLLLALASRTLPYAVTEVQGIAPYLDHPTVLIGKAFDLTTMAANLQQSSGIIHLVTHAPVADDSPLSSYLVLRDDFGRSQASNINTAQVISGRDSMTSASAALQINDILKLNLSDNTLAVLSACKTALGQQTSGEGMMGLTQAFLVAGVPRLLTSLWDVDDRHTADLMQRFYRHLCQNSVPPAAALRLAQLEIIEELKNSSRSFPFHLYWAAFVLTGRAN